ncbi:hypothetical protein PACTADRAFT_78594 [Pachysolen tannophilus NRRL Y-2460]|uniref:Tubulin gamma chain n=1 Tax=Pachysolen tannophilus NRRL Y-2460 TaxID=669874 RepID=A0A1E4U2I1_PACTA|nr:hypothetical protein PACTADRAFT_78594 [Pachysolen tannophilus NRRL Y-2460]
MPGEIITIQAGQCGNQIGQKFWQQLCNEHGILPDGTGMPVPDSVKIREDQTNIFFQSNSDDNRYTPRALLIDLEPRVVSSITSNFTMFNPRNIHLASNGGGAGNIWAQGYKYATGHSDEFMDMLDKELDKCDSLEGFQLIHSVAGGTGSGVGSYLLEMLSDRYAKKLNTTFSIFPEMEQTSDVVVQPYNTVLTLKRLIESSDANIVFDNGALSSIALNNLQVKSPSFEQTNQLVSTVMSAITNPLRFPSYSYNTMTSIISTLIPTPDLHFLTPTYTPFTSDFVSEARDIRKSTAYDVILELLDKKLKMVKSSPDNHGLYISALDIIQGDIEQSDIQKGLIKAQQRIEFVPWTSSSVHLAKSKRSPFLKQKINRTPVSGLMLSNQTSIVSLFNKVLSQYDKLMKRNAFVEAYRKHNYDGFDILEEFQNSRDMVESLIDEYRNSESMKYLEDDEEDEEFGIASTAVADEEDAEMLG